MRMTPSLLKTSLIVILYFSLMTSKAIEYDAYSCTPNKVSVKADCLKNHLKKLRVKHISLKKLVTQQMIELDDATLRADALKAYQASERSFQSFVRRNCAWHAASVMGGIDGQHSALQCEIHLIQSRLEELRAALGH